MIPLVKLKGNYGIQSEHFFENMTQKNSNILFFIFKMHQTIVSDHISRDIASTSPRQVLLGFPRILTGVSTDLSNDLFNSSELSVIQLAGLGRSAPALQSRQAGARRRRAEGWVLSAFR